MTSLNLFNYNARGKHVQPGIGNMGSSLLKSVGGIQMENADLAKNVKTVKRNRFHTFLVILLVVIFLLLLIARNYLYIPILPRKLSAYHKKSSEGTTYYIQPLGYIDDESLAYMKDFLAADSKMPVVVLDTMPIPKEAWGRPKQANADRILPHLIRDMRTRNDAFRMVAVTQDDLYSGNLNFVLGLSSFTDNVMVISLYMLRPRTEDLQYVDKIEGNNLKLYHDRIRKILRHEIGHSFTLRHCINPFCDMAFANTVAQQDWQSEYYCPICQVKLALMKNN
jgi:predicted Zn-dependent protease